jgi:hypothetical protein
MNLVNKRLKIVYYVSIKIPLFRGTTLPNLNVSENRTARRMVLRRVTYLKNEEECMIRRLHDDFSRQM